MAVVMVEARDTPASEVLEPIMKPNCSRGCEDQYVTVVVEPTVIQNCMTRLAVLQLDGNK